MTAPARVDGSEGLSAPAPVRDALLLSVGTLLESRRKRLGLTIAQMTRAAGIARGSYHGLLAATTEPKLRTVVKLARVLGLRVGFSEGRTQERHGQG